MKHLLKKGKVIKLFHNDEIINRKTDMGKQIFMQNKCRQKN